MFTSLILERDDIVAEMMKCIVLYLTLSILLIYIYIYICDSFISDHRMLTVETSIHISPPCFPQV